MGETAEAAESPPTGGGVRPEPVALRERLDRVDAAREHLRRAFLAIRQDAGAAVSAGEDAARTLQRAVEAMVWAASRLKDYYRLMAEYAAPEPAEESEEEPEEEQTAEEAAEESGQGETEEEGAGLPPRFTCTAEAPWTPERGSRVVHTGARFLEANLTAEGLETTWECAHCGAQWTRPAPETAAQAARTLAREHLLAAQKAKLGGALGEEEGWQV